MRHHVSTNQLVLWPHHELTEAWARTGILCPPQKGIEIRGQEVREKGARADEANRGIDIAPALSASTVLTRNGGVCGLVTWVHRRHRGPRRAGLAGSRRSVAVGLV